MNVGEHIIDRGRVRIVRACGVMVLDSGLRVQTIWTRDATQDEVTDEDREAMEAGRRVTRAIRDGVPL